YIKPKKSLGQHFLKDKNIAQKIVNALLCENINHVLEVGPGKGILTQFLIINKNYVTYVVEIDKNCIEYLTNIYKDLQGRIINNDFLKINLKDHFNEKIALIGNFPYNISSQIFFKILENREMIGEVVCMIQKEVADRICSKPKNKIYGILSVLLQAYYNIDFLFTVNPGVFEPPPKIKSAVIRLQRNKNKKLNCNEDLFKKIVKTAFNQRRKILRNSLKNILKEDLKDNILLLRPEQLGYTEFIYLTNLIEGFIK
ncbi:MAG: 16S rRNA (adenine(1518)-N(6)/adenine(1519)-N(6))-dimethyltransferase RsmA, partial [Bacteroidales bacterium]|nr:16S rRNA (adenine(1518)-N(6)/adenine(1519)-N(6))-dimethyltransferase RsmA [Bacteroidales bacterium]